MASKSGFFGISPSTFAPLVGTEELRAAQRSRSTPLRFEPKSPGSAAGKTANAAEAAQSDAQRPDHLDFALAGVIGAELSTPLATMQYVLAEFIRTRNVTRSQMQLLSTSLDVARSIATQSQQIARLATGRLRQSHERLKLDELLRERLAEQQGPFQQRGIELYQSLKPVEVIVDASLLSSLIDASIDWAMGMGRRLVVKLEMKNWPEHGILLLTASESVSASAAAQARGDGDTLGWFLLQEIGRAMGVSVERSVSPGEASLLIEFPRTVKRLEGLTAIEVDTGMDSLHSDSKPMAGHRVLMVTVDDRLRAEVNQIARAIGLVFDCVPTTAQAVRFCELDAPHLVLIDERLRDEIFDELKDDLRKTDPNFPFIEIAIKSNTLEMAGWMSDSMTRMSRDTISGHLSSILAMELAKVM